MADVGLSTPSLGITLLVALVYARDDDSLAFNSLSRDHKAILRNGKLMAIVKTFNSLSRDHQVR